MTRVLIVGAGASGLTAAIYAARNGASVTVLEQNDKPGKKLLATGNGKCNITNLDQTPDKYRSAHQEFPWKVVRNFDVQKTIAFFTELGIYVRNKNGYLYPYSEQAAAMTEVLLMEAARLKVKIKTREQVEAVKKHDRGFTVITKTWKYEGDKVILACGSPASAIEGSCDDGIQIAKSFGHPVVPFEPALVGLRGCGLPFTKWAGVRMTGSVTLLLDGNPVRTESGELQFTDYGISGIPVFQLSRYAVRAISEHCPAALSLDLMPDFTLTDLAEFLKRRMDRNPNKSLSESLIGLLPDKMIRMLCKSGSTADTLAADLKQLTFDIKGASSLKQAQICSGGVDTEQICPDTMESALVPGLYFAGENADVDGMCGGYNLQWAWSSGAIAGTNAAKEQL